MPSHKQEPVFDLIKSLSKAEKRNFKLYATRLVGNQEAKFLTLFDCMEGMEEYDEMRILLRCPIKKEQLPNMKAHLYKQLLVSIRLLNVQHTLPMQLREQVDFARILYDKGLYRQSVKILDKAKEQAVGADQYASAIEIIEFQKQIETLNISKDMASRVEQSTRQAVELSNRLANINEISNLSMQLYGLYLKLGYARTQKDLNLITQVFKAKLEQLHTNLHSFTERYYYYQAMAWYNYIQHDLLGSYTYACRWIALFDATPSMKHLMYDSYLRGYSRLLDGLFLLRNHHRFKARLKQLEVEVSTVEEISDNSRMIAMQVIYTNRINAHFAEGTFAEGVKIVPEIEQYFQAYKHQLDVHHRMVINYKIACLYFGNGDYRPCMEYLGRIISTRDPQIRRDLQCYARILNLIASYDAGIDYNLDYQVRSVYLFLVKMNDMHEVQKAMMSFLKRLNSMYDSNLKEELRALYDTLKPLEQHPYERRTFYYLDVLSWLESKIKGISVAEVIRARFLRDNP